MVTKAGNVTVPQQISFFVGGLRNQIRTDVKGQRPRALKEDLGFAKLYESRGLAQRSNRLGVVQGKNSDNLVTTTNLSVQGEKTYPTIKKLTVEEMVDRKSKVCILMVMKSSVQDITVRECLK